MVREDAVLYLLEIPRGDDVTILVQSKPDGDHRNSFNLCFIVIYFYIYLYLYTCTCIFPYFKDQ